MTQKIIYVSYGTNMDTNRFMKYIQGGSLEGSGKTYKGCRDKTPPTHKLTLKSSSHEGYFARNSSVWGEAPYNVDGSGIYGGLGVIGIKPNVEQSGVQVVDPAIESLKQITARGEMVLAGYAITFEQFNDVMVQENAKALADVVLPNNLLEAISSEAPLLDLRNRTGSNAIMLEDGTTIEIEMKGAYCAILYLGEIEIDGEKVKAVTFTTPFDYDRAAAQSYVNMLLVNVPPESMELAGDLANDAIKRTIGEKPADNLHRLNPATTGYVEMVANGVEELGGGQSDWTRENAVEYALSQPPFDEHQFPGLADLVRESLVHISRNQGLDQNANKDISI